MSAGHAFTEPTLAVRDEEYLSHCIWSEARALRSMTGADLAAERELIEDAREMLNDALAKADAHIARQSMPSLFERMH